MQIYLYSILRLTRMNLFEIKHWFIHILKAKNEHSLHSPFMFELYNSCIKNKSKQIEKLIISLGKHYSKDNINIVNNIEEIIEILPKSEDKILIYPSQYKNKSRETEFKEIINSPNTRVIVDLFSLALIINNPKLKKQYYRLR